MLVVFRALEVVEHGGEAHGGQRVQFDVADELTALRAARLAAEFELEAMLLGSGYEFRHLDSVAATGLSVIVPLSYPERPKVSSLLEAGDVSLRRMMTWEQAPTNARRLVEAGVTVALTTHRLDKRSEFPAALSKTIKHGLDEDDALVFFRHRLANVRKLYPYVPQELNDVLMRFSRSTTRFYDNLDAITGDLRQILDSGVLSV